MRQKGYGNTILKLGLKKAKELGFDKLLLTCDETNISSNKIIIKNGGVLESTINGRKRYWIMT
jgi:predicted acetyltransferase